MLHEIIDFIVSTVSQWGYVGIFFMMFLESSFFPFPSEVVMIPAGFLAHKGEMSLVAAFASGVAGSLAGAAFNYYLCFFFGRLLGFFNVDMVFFSQIANGFRVGEMLVLH